MDQGDELTLAYVVRPGEHNERLRYSLRSIAAHLPYAHVVVIGHKPSWVRGVEHVYVLQPHGHRSNVPGLIRHFVEAKVADEWVLMNDDFFAMKPDPCIENVYSTTLEQLAYKPGWRSGWYKRARDVTARLLEHRGVVDPMSYDRVHRPMAMNNEILVSLLAEAGEKDILVRSLYGNLVPGGQPGPDAKVRGFTAPVPDTDWVSVGRESWQGRAGSMIRSRFGSKCQFEA